VAALARLVVIPRNGMGFDPETPAALKVMRELGLPGFVPVGVEPSDDPAPILLHAASLPISGSDLRRRAREGRSLAFRMPEAVVSYIRDQQLYRPGGLMAILSAEAVVRVAARAALEKKAIELVVLDLQGLSSVADYFCLQRAVGPQADTIADAVRGAARGGRAAAHNEGSAESGWLLLDYADVVVHVFLEETRGFYSLERLWGDAPLVSVEGGGARD
jgi:ribosome-associated protein